MGNNSPDSSSRYWRKPLAAAFDSGMPRRVSGHPDLDRDAVRKIVSVDTCFELPEVIEEAIRGLQAKRESMEAGPRQRPCCGSPTRRCARTRWGPVSGYR